MKLSCEVVRDLLPLYYDQVCSEESVRLVKEHLEECSACQAELHAMEKKFSCPKSHVDEAEPIKAIAKEWKKDKKNSFAKGATSTMAIFSIISAILCLVCVVSYNAIGQTILEDGTLSEPFALIPLGYLFAFIAILSFLSFVIIKCKKK